MYLDTLIVLLLLLSTIFFLPFKKKNSTSLSYFQLRTVKFTAYFNASIS